ncbi:hypothetical protein DACRYDRAFT_77739 [Dacryopinax primogenitus]|uniref:Hemerythrin-like domain-containing protein n=1 Tax=Dacryopinax primogenitus (strain DJM 731) TaxID=1858805 RepID=M5G6V4_DACPD|nr:uncharacterized protein DACRYDRAFT_77739 [Dacryopinax primogenitus]EJU03940.1 hypothetical protein DACRYDRAFT_77739 [Dacryopinax primogenitus]
MNCMKWVFGPCCCGCAYRGNDWQTADRKRLGPSLLAFFRQAMDFIHHLEMHHGIEEQHIFPVLQRKMPDFAKGAKHRNSHKGIHEGLDRLEALIKDYRNDPKTYSPVEFRACLDSFRDVLFSHLDEEVADLQGENLKKFCTLAEVQRLPM